MTKKSVPIYMNNAATGFPKFPAAIKAMNDSLASGVLSANRDSVISEKAKLTVFDLRKKIGNLLSAKEPHEVVFTPSDTIALNMALQGIHWRKDDVLLIDSMSHNAIARPAMAIAKKFGVIVICINSMEALEEALKTHDCRVRAAAFSHGSNVTGDVIPVVEIGKILEEHHVPFILDVAQTIGLYPIDVEENRATIVAFAGHKGLNGMQGTGGFYIRKNFQIEPILFGGTGSDSMSLAPENVYPESYEVGTPAMHDLIALHASMETIEAMGYENYGNAIRAVTQYAYDELVKLPSVILYGGADKKLPVISFNVKGITCKEVGTYLGEKGIICRTGVHCASLAMYQLGCVEEFGGTVRVSFGLCNTKDDVNRLVDIIKSLL